MSRPEDDALSWDGDDDPTLVPGSVDEPPASGPAVEPEPADAPVGDAEAPEPAGLGNVALVSYGVLGGVYALWIAGWILGSLRLRAWIETATGSAADVMFHASMVLAIAAPVLWFFTAVVATRLRTTGTTFLWLGIGLVLLVPWPFVMVGVIGQ